MVGPVAVGLGVAPGLALDLGVADVLDVGVVLGLALGLTWRADSAAVDAFGLVPAAEAEPVGVACGVADPLGWAAGLAAGLPL